MGRVPLPELAELARRGAGGALDPDDERALYRALEEYLPRRRERLSPATIQVDGAPYPSLVAAALEHSLPWGKVDFALTEPPAEARAWEFLLPVTGFTLAEDGSAELRLKDGAAPETRRAMARVVVREHFVPRTTATLIRERPDLFSLPQFARYLSEGHAVPFAVAFALYLPESRLRFEFDLLDSGLLPDPRQGRLPLARHVPRTSRLAHGLDLLVARGDLPLPTARALEVLSETHGLTASELSQVFGGVRELGISTLEALHARRLAAYDKRTGLYRPRLEAFLSPADRAAAGDEALPAPVNAALRTSVTELLAAADARATCPLCGNALPPGPRGILCADCSELVGAASGPAAPPA
jgi:hypothetical protein